MCTANYAEELCEKRLSSKTEGKVGDVSNYMHLFHQSVLLVRSLTAKHHSECNLRSGGVKHLMPSRARRIFQLLHQSLSHLSRHHCSDKSLFMACSILPVSSGRKFPFLSHCRISQAVEQPKPPPAFQLTVQFDKIFTPAWGQNCSPINSLNTGGCLLNPELCKLQVNLSTCCWSEVSAEAKAGRGGCDHHLVMDTLPSGLQVWRTQVWLKC